MASFTVRLSLSSPSRFLGVFLSNPTKRFIRTSNGESAYTWEVPKIVDGEEVLDANGNPEMETQTYTLEQLHDFTIPPATKSGMGYMDFITEKKQLFTDTQGKIKIEDIRSKVDKIIPTDVKGLRSWAYSNPTDNSDLDIKGYLLDRWENDREKYLNVYDRKKLSSVLEGDGTNGYEAKTPNYFFCQNGHPSELGHELVSSLIEKSKKLTFGKIMEYKINAAC